VIAYRAMIDVPRELVQYLGRLLAAERRAKGTLYLPTSTSVLLEGIPTYEDDLGVGSGALIAVTAGDYAMMLPQAAATGIPGYHERVRAAAATAWQRPG
jgi:hypothetical protein